MRDRDWRIWAYDIREPVARIRSYIEGMTFDDFAADRKTADAVIRNLAIIGEASNNIPPEIRELSRLTPWTDIRRMRNLLTHRYFCVSLPVVWQVVTDDLEDLDQQMRQLMEQED